MQTVVSVFTQLLAILALLVALGCAADDVSPGGLGGPAEGLWQGDELSFVLQAGAIEELQLAPQSCAADGCTAEVGGKVPGRHALAGLIGVNSDDVTLEGSFDGLYMASGSFTARAANGCCEVVGAWSAKWVKALPGVGAGSSGGASSGGNSSGAAVIGSVDWGGASTGDMHPDPRRASPVAEPNTALLDHQNDALTALNALRAGVGVGPVQQDPALAKAAQAHAAFYVQHHAKYKQKKLNPHQQDKSFGDGYTGKSLGERLKAAGYSGPPGSEVMAFTGSIAGALQGWMDTVYHRLPLIDPRSSLMGFGMASAGKARAEVIDFGRGGGSADVIVYPTPGQTGIARSWSGNEGPQPPKPKTGYPSGPVVTARFEAAIQVLDHKFLDAAGQALEHVWLTADNDKNLAMFDSKTVVLYANDPIASGTYTVVIDVEINKKKRRLQWSFSTK